MKIAPFPLLLSVFFVCSHAVAAPNQEAKNALGASLLAAASVMAGGIEAGYSCSLNTNRNEVMSFVDRAANLTHENILQPISPEEIAAIRAVPNLEATMKDFLGWRFFVTGLQMNSEKSQDAVKKLLENTLPFTTALRFGSPMQSKAPFYSLELKERGAAVVKVGSETKTAKWTFKSIPRGFDSAVPSVTVEFEDNFYPFYVSNPSPYRAALVEPLDGQIPTAPSSAVVWVQDPFGCALD